ncbi:DNA repair and recombination protein RadA [Candidatus Woesearchaeota archaeon]|nr:DNA repair and recombination protein RadA [Candidatus Woesearchaeota archaeon]
MSNRKTEILEQVQEVMPEEKIVKKTKIENVEDLPGVGPATAEKLKESGYDSLLSLAVASPGELVEAGGLTESTARKVIKAARDAMNMGFESGDELLERRKNILKITTGSKTFDGLLGGGFEAGSITECFGEFGSSKTQIGHQLAVNTQLPKEKGGAEGVCIYIDTEGAFRPERIKQMAEALGLDPIPILKNIKVARAFNSDHQMLLAEKVEDLIKNEGLNVKLLVVDSLMSHFRADFSGRGQLADRQQKLNKHMHALQKLATAYNLVVYVTNQVMAKPDTFFGDPTAAIGGHIVGHNSSTRIYLRKGKKGTRVAKLIDSPHLPDGEAIFNVEESGLKDV